MTHLGKSRKSDPLFYRALSTLNSSYVTSSYSDGVWYIVKGFMTKTTYSIADSVETAFISCRSRSNKSPVVKDS